MTQIRPLIVGNWKMNLSLGESIVLAESIKEGLADLSGFDAVLCPPFPFLGPVAEALSRHRLQHLLLGAQNIFWKEEGAYTGEVAAPMLRGLADFVIIGHSERRRVFHESEAEIIAKVKLAIKHGLRPIVCVGELKKAAGGQPPSQLVKELETILAALPTDDQAKLIIAYEPVWAISTNPGAKAADGHYANVVCFHLRQELPAEVPVLYGGSVSAENAPEFLSQPEINGVLVGGASLTARSFLAICRAAV